ncbi:TPA: hypothetical protein DIV49_02735 [Candidatus Saccharibacteria bacterium]|nr:hypothetical protein [Candidatus Saccharibacteria bacterium]HRJ90784.1 hypothetical protein [Candidatus Saccharibacteria bacterium]
MVLYDMAPTDLQHEREPREVETFVALDLDRTLLNSDVLGDVQCDILADFGIGQDEIDAHKAHIAANKGNSFPVVNYLTDTYGAELVTSLQERLLARASEPAIRAALLFEGVIELLGALESKDVPYGVLTFGEQENQSFKLRLFELLTDREGKILSEITSENNKSDYIHHQWQNTSGVGSGTFAIPEHFTHDRPITAHHVILLDDKGSHLDTEHSDIGGMLVGNLPDEAGAYPEGTHRLGEFTEVVRQLAQGEPLRLPEELRYQAA